MKITEKLKDKKILIWGYGREGKSTHEFINKYCQAGSVEVFEGAVSDIDHDKYDCIIKSPGIKVDVYHEKYTSQTELFLEEFGHQTIGITGTKGKSTTSSLIYTVLKENLNQKVLLVGNIGLPCLDYYGEIESDTVVVFEMSCHQLSNIKFSPHIAVFLNLFEDHLDYYGTRQKYFEAKKNITTHQQENDYCFFGEDVPAFETLADTTVIKYAEALDFTMKLKGAHNQFNATVVYRICSKLFGCSDDKIRASISNFDGLAHRLEYVGKIEGIDFYNDSISTIPEATIQAIESISNTKTVMIGGMDRHINYDKLVSYVKAHTDLNYILSYESGARIYEELKDLKCCYYKESLREAVILAKEITPVNGACVFSPAAASYGYFKNFEERGEVYKQLVKEEE